MRIVAFVSVALVVVSAIASQNPSNAAPDWSTDPQKMLAAAAPLYGFNDPALKPFRLKGAYQLYDDAGKPTQQGTYEYAWSAPKVYRSTWTRTDASRTEWHTADGKVMYQKTGDRLFYLERELERLLFSPLPDPGKLDPAGVEVKKGRIEMGKIKLPCVEIKRRLRADGTAIVLGSPSGTYCFDPSIPVVRVARINTGMDVGFDNLVKTQGRVLARQITISEGRYKLLTFSLDVVKDFGKDDDPSLTAPSDAKVLSAPLVEPADAISALLKKPPPPVYPQQAKAEGISGTVILDAVIRADGNVSDMRVLATPSPLLTRASTDAVAHWQYSPYVVDGQPQEVTTLINVIFSLGQ